MLVVRYFAGARAAAGTPEEKVDGRRRWGSCWRPSSAARPRLADVLRACSFLVDGLAWQDRPAPLPVRATVDVLPPFAGG